MLENLFNYFFNNFGLVLGTIILSVLVIIVSIVLIFIIAIISEYISNWLKSRSAKKRAAEEEYAREHYDETQYKIWLEERNKADNRKENNKLLLTSLLGLVGMLTPLIFMLHSCGFFEGGNSSKSAYERERDKIAQEYGVSNDDVDKAYKENYKNWK